MIPSESLFAVPKNKLFAKLRFVGHQMLLRCQITVIIGVSVKFRANIKEVGKQVPLLVVHAEPALFLLHGLHL